MSNNNKLYRIIIILSIVGLILPNFSLAQEEFSAAMPQTVGEAKDLMTTILAKLPEAVKGVWKEEALPLWQKMWEWARPVVEPWWNKLSGLLGKEVEKRRPGLEQEFQKENEEMQRDLWEKFKELLK